MFISFQVIFFLALTFVLAKEDEKLQTEKPQDETKENEKSEIDSKDKRGLSTFGLSGSEFPHLQNFGNLQDKTTVLYKDVHVPLPIEKHVPVPIEKFVPYPIRVGIPQPYPVQKIVYEPYNVYVKVPVPIHKPVPVEKFVPVAVKVPYDQPYPVKVFVPQPYPVEKPVPTEVKIPHSYTFEKKGVYSTELKSGMMSQFLEKMPYTLMVPIDNIDSKDVKEKLTGPSDKQAPVQVRYLVPYSEKIYQNGYQGSEKNHAYPVFKHVPYPTFERNLPALFAKQVDVPKYAVKEEIEQSYYPQTQDATPQEQKAADYYKASKNVQMYQTEQKYQHDLNNKNTYQQVYQPQSYDKTTDLYQQQAYNKKNEEYLQNQRDINKKNVEVYQPSQQEIHREQVYSSFQQNTENFDNKVKEYQQNSHFQYDKQSKENQFIKIM